MRQGFPGGERSAWVSFALLATLAACGGGSPAAPPAPTPAPTPTPTPAPATLADLTAATTSTEAGRTINCNLPVTARVSLTNRAASSVAVSGVRRAGRIDDGDCNAAPEFTFRTLVSSVGPARTTVVFDGPLYSRGSGCCDKARGCDGQTTCAIEQTFQVLTGVGSVEAGSFIYRVNFDACPTCSKVAGASANRPASP